MIDNTSSKRFLNDAILKDIRDAVESLTSGEIHITIREKKITQIEVAERKSFDDMWNIEDGGGI